MAIAKNKIYILLLTLVLTLTAVILSSTSVFAKSNLHKDKIYAEFKFGYTWSDHDIHNELKYMYAGDVLRMDLNGIKYIPGIYSDQEETYIDTTEDYMFENDEYSVYLDVINTHYFENLKYGNNDDTIELDYVMSSEIGISVFRNRLHESSPMFNDSRDILEYEGDFEYIEITSDHYDKKFDPYDWDYRDGYRYQSFVEDPNINKWVDRFTGTNVYTSMIRTPKKTKVDYIEYYNTGLNRYIKIDNNDNNLEAKMTIEGNRFQPEGKLELYVVNIIDGSKVLLDEMNWIAPPLADREDQVFRVRFKETNQKLLFDNKEVPLEDYNFIDYGRRKTINEVSWESGYKFNPIEYLKDTSKEYSFESPEGYQMFYSDFDTKTHKMVSGKVTINYVDSKWVYKFDDIEIEKKGTVGLEFIFVENKFSVITLEKELSGYRKLRIIVRKGSNINEVDHLRWNDNIASGNISVWYYDQDFTKPVLENEKLEKDITLYRRTEYYDSTFTLNYDVDGGDYIEPYIVDRIDYDIGPTKSYYLSDVGLEELPIPTRKGYVFVKWKHSTISHNFPIERLHMTGNEQTIKAVWVKEIEELDVTFINMDRDAGSFDTTTYKVIAGSKIDISKMTIPEANPRYKFTGWIYGRVAGKADYVDFNKPITESTNFYAHFEKIDYYTINFYVDGGVAIPEMKLKIRNFPENEPDKFNSLLPIGVKARYAFVGWYLDQELTVEAPELVYGNKEEGRMFYDITLYAKYLFNGVRLYHETNWDAYQIGPMLLTKNEEFIAPPPPLRTGYDFIGWFLDQELTILYDGMGFDTDEATIYAKWERNGDEIPPDIKDDNTLTKDQIMIFVFIGIGISILSMFLFGGRRRRRR